MSSPPSPKSPPSYICKELEELKLLNEHEVEELDVPESMLFEERFNRLFEGSIDSDCEFLVGPQQDVVKGHKLIFSMASEVFYAMFYSQLKEDSVVKIDDLELDGFEGMKHFIYTGNVNFTSALQACLTYVAARKYLISQLGKKCIDYIKEQEIPPSEVLKLYGYCKVNKIPEIEEKCRLVIQEKSRDVVESEYFLSANINTIDLIMRLESVNLKSELELFNHFQRWAAAEADRQKICGDDMATSFNSLKKNIRFLTMKEEEFTSGPAKSLLLTQEEKLAVLLNIMDLGSTPYPDSFFVEQKERKFGSFNHEELELLENEFLDQEKFKCLLKGSIISDCEFIVGPQQNIVKGHKLIFSMASGVFHKMFYSETKEDSVVKVDDLDIDGFEGMKHFIYTGNVNFSTAFQACSTFIASNKYSIPKLGEKCIEYIEKQDIAPSDVLRLYEFSKDKEISVIVEKCIAIIQEKTEDVVKSEYFLSANIDTIDSIMKLQTINLKSEMELFSHLERWALAEAGRKELGDKIATSFNSLKKHIRFLTMSGKEFTKGPATSPLLTQQEKLNIGLNIMDLGSAPYPEHFSLQQEERNFAAFESKYEYRKIFLVFDTDLPDELSEDFKLSISDCGDWVINVFKCKGNICFRLEPVEFIGNYLISFKTKLRVVARKKKYNDLLIETECCFAFDEDEYTEEAGRIDIVIAVIPWDKVNRTCYVDNNKAVTIEGSFVFNILFDNAPEENAGNAPEENDDI